MQMHMLPIEQMGKEMDKEMGQEGGKEVDKEVGELIAHCCTIFLSHLGIEI